MGSTHHFIVDTGSSFNILPIQMKQKLELNGVDMKTANDVKLRGVKGTELKVVGQVTLPLVVNSYHTSTEFAWIIASTAQQNEWSPQGCCPKFGYSYSHVPRSKGVLQLRLSRGILSVKNLKEAPTSDCMDNSLNRPLSASCHELGASRGTCNDAITFGQDYRRDGRKCSWELMTWQEGLKIMKG